MKKTSKIKLTLATLSGLASLASLSLIKTLDQENVLFIYFSSLLHPFTWTIVTAASAAISAVLYGLLSLIR